jgi:putative transposon-encoded protein
MRKVPINPVNQILVKNIQGYFERSVTRFGTGAKVNIPKEHLGKKVVIIVYN